MRELAEEVIQLTGSKSKIEYQPLPGDDPKQREPIIEKASDLLNWKPLVVRSEGLKKTVEYFKSTI